MDSVSYMHLRSPIAMPLPFPAKPSRPRLIEVLFAVAIVVGLCASAVVARPAPRCARRARAPAAGSDRSRPRTLGGLGRAERCPRRGTRGPRSSSGRCATAGFASAPTAARARSGATCASRIGTVAAADARPGDVLFFDTRATDADPDCDDVTDHAGLVESVEPDGRITFVEARGRPVRRSFVDPAHPTLRRNARGEIANSFLRAEGRGRSAGRPLLRRRDALRRRAPRR